MFWKALFVVCFIAVIVLWPMISFVGSLFFKIALALIFVGIIGYLIKGKSK